MEYIKINSIEDIDLSKISIRDINKRYIDRNGLRYATRFNMEKRRVEIIQIVKGKREADRLWNRCHKKSDLSQSKTLNVSFDEKLESSEVKQVASEFEELEKSYHPEMPGSESESEDFIFDEGQTEGIFYEKAFMRECMEDFEKMKGRMIGVGNMIRNSRVFSPASGSDINDLIREIDIKCIQSCDETVNYFKELTSYPRPLSYYMGRLKPEQITRIDAVVGDEQKMEFTIRYEMRHAIMETYTRILTIFNRLLILLKKNVPTEKSDIPATGRRFYLDAMAASEFIIKNCQKNLNKIKIWKSRYL